MGNQSGPSTSSEKLSGKIFSDVWIIDTGASHYMTRHSKILSDTHNIIPWLVGLPKGKQALQLKVVVYSLGNI